MSNIFTTKLKLGGYTIYIYIYIQWKLKQNVSGHFLVIKLAKTCPESQ